MATPSFYPIKGGTETMVQNFAIELNKMGVNVDVMTFNMDRKWNPRWRGKTEKINGITVFKVPALNWLPIVHSPRVTLGVNVIPGRFTNLLKQYDVVHFHEADFSFPLFSFFARKPKIFHLHGISVDFWKRYHLSRFILTHVANLYISISKQMRKDLIDLGIPQEKIAYVPNAVNVELFCPRKEKEDNLLLFVGRITFDKGLHVLIKSLHYLKESVHLVIVGSADWDRSYYQDVFNTSVKKVNREGKHKITYLGALNQTDVVEWYQKASVFVLPSFSEALPVVVLEALSCETPVLATPVGGIPEIVRNHENGILIPPNNPLKLAEAIQYLLDNKDVRVGLGREGRKSVKTNFSSEVIAKKLCRIYNTMINR